MLAGMGLAFVVGCGSDHRDRLRAIIGTNDLHPVIQTSANAHLVKAIGACAKAVL